MTCSLESFKINVELHRLLDIIKIEPEFPKFYSIQTAQGPSLSCFLYLFDSHRF